MTWAVLAVAVLLGAGMRFSRLGTVPPGLYHDEALNGQDALGILEGERPIFFEANNGREPLFFYGMALALSVWGRTPFAVRVTAAILGTLTVPATFLMARALFNKHVGLWSAVLIAVAPWPVNLSRIGLRAVSMPLVVALALWLWWSGQSARGWGRLVRLLLGGALFGLSLYTYTAARFVFVALAVYALFQTWADHKRLDRVEWVCLVLVAALVAIPLAVYGVSHWETFVGRSAQVSILNPSISHGDPLGTLARNIIRAAGLFTFQGDAIPRHNIPHRPLYDPVISIMFYLGVLLCLGKMRRDAARALALIWTVVMLTPTVLAEDCPHFLRAVGVLPMATVFPALGLDWMRERLAERGSAQVGNLSLVAVLIVSSAWSIRDYWLGHAQDGELGYAFEADQVQEAIEINQFLGTGWQGKGIAERAGQATPGRHVYLGPRLWEDRHATNFLVGSPEQVSILGRDPAVRADQVLVLAWPHSDLGNVRAVLPDPARIDIWHGPLERGDLDLEPRLLYVAFRGDTLATASTPLAQFQEGIELLDWRAEDVGGEAPRVDVRWRTLDPLLTDYTVFVHMERDGVIVAQDDRTPGAGYYVTTWWKPGDEISDIHILKAPYNAAQDRIWVGWYEWGSMRHLRVLDKNGQPGDDRLALQ